MKSSAVLLALLLIAVDAAAQTPAPYAPQIAQGGPSAPAGSAATGATLPPANTGASASVTAVAIGFTIAAFATAIASGYNNTTAPNH